MILPRKIVHLLLILSELILIAVAITMIVHYQILDDSHKLWMASKTLTIENIIRWNNNNTYPFTYLGDTGIYYAYKSKYNYAYLLEHSGSSCEAHYKKCGILDTMKNIMCLPETDECPINDVLDEAAYNKSTNPEKYIKSGDLYYSNKMTDNDIIAKVSSYSSNYIIDKSNFVFDQETYDDVKPSSSSSSSSSYDDYHVVFDGDGADAPVRYDGCREEGSGCDKDHVGKRNRKLYSTDDYGNSDFTDYIEQRFKDDINKDNSFRKLDYNAYGGNYLGFKDYSSLEKFSNLDLHALYIISFPNKAADVFCYFLAVIFTGMVIYSIIRLIKEEENYGFNNSDEALGEQLLLIIPYIIFFVGFFLYIVYEYDNIYNKLRHEELIEIKGDPFFEDLLKEVYDRNPKPYLMFLFIALYILSMIIFALAWILNYFFAKKHKYF